MGGRTDLALRLAAPEPLLLDGATGTELEARGVRSDLPLWSARALLEAPETVAAIHRDYVRAGAEALTANTFRTQRRTLTRAGLGPRARELTRRAVELAREAARPAGRRVFVLGSVPPLEDCFRPDLVPDAATLRAEHGEHVRHLVEAGVDALLVETMNSAREAEAAARAARELDVPALVSFVCWHGPRLLSGEPLSDAIARVAPLGPLAVLVNCLPPSNAAACVAVLADVGRPTGLYPNLGAPVGAAGERSESLDPRAFARRARRWLDAGLRIVGGCCGTGPAHIEAVARVLRSRRAAR